MLQLFYIITVFSLAPILVIFVIQIILFRLLKNKNPQIITVISMLIGLIYPIIFVYLNNEKIDLWENIYVFLNYSFFAYAYFHFFNMSETSRRIQLLHFLSENKNANLESVKKLFENEDVIQVRIERLKSSKQIIEKNKKFELKSNFLLLTAKIIYFMSCLFGVPWKQIKKLK